MAKPMMVCTQCGTQTAKPKRGLHGNAAVELLLYIAFIIPGLLYSFWRSSNRPPICPSCHSANTMIPADSPRGRELSGAYGTSSSP